VKVVASNSAAFLLSDDGTIFAWGTDDKKIGLLGLGQQYALYNPCPVNSLLDYKYSLPHDNIRI